MRNLRTFLCFCLAVTLAIVSEAQASNPGQKLMLVGGGDTPVAALSRFCEWAGGKKARILAITWATGHPEETFKDFADEYSFCHAASIEAAPVGPFSVQQKHEFLNRLESYTAIFFTGGDQNRILDVLAGWGDEGLTRKLQDLYRQGIPFGGTSAGTAVMSSVSITGNGDWTVIDGEAVETRAGLGLLDGVILDTHFVRRQRENRLFGLTLKHPSMLGVGIDQDTALLVTDGLHGEVQGRAQVMLVDGAAGGGSLALKLLHAGDLVQLGSLKRPKN